MPLPARIIVTLTSLGSFLFLAHQVRELFRRKRNLKHFERNEPLEKVDDW